MFEMETAGILGIIAGIVLTIFLYVKIIPSKFNNTLDTDFKQWLHDFFNFKKLYLESVLKFSYVLATVTCVTVGAFLLLGYEEYSYRGYYSRESTFLTGLLLMLLGPISIRLSYELIMMAILLVKNVMEINKKLPDNNAPAEPAEPVVEQSKGWTCSCGRINPDYVTTCACGCCKPHNQ